MKSNKTKIIYIAHSGGLQGAGFALLNIINGLPRSIIEPTVILPSKGELYKRLVKLNVKCYIIRCYNETYPRICSLKDIFMYIPRMIRTKIVNSEAINKLSKIVEKESPDAIHTNTGVIRYGNWVAKKYQIPHFWHIREYQLKDSDYNPLGGLKKLQRLFQDHNNHCIAITKGLFDFAGLNDKYDTVIYDGVFSEVFEPKPVTSKQKYFLFCGALTESKGVYEVIDAFQNISEYIPEYQLLLAGQDIDNVQKYLKEHKYSDKIVILGFRDDVYDLMSNAIALIVSSKCEGFGFISVEAMLNKTLVIGKNTAGLKEQFDNGLELTGEDIGYRYVSQKELESHMLHLTSEDIAYQKPMIDRAYNSVRRLYSIETNIKMLINFYSKFIDLK